jgi:hypothetical protein
VNQLLRGPPRSIVNVEVARGWAELPIRAEIRCVAHIARLNTCFCWSHSRAPARPSTEAHTRPITFLTPRRRRSGRRKPIPLVPEQSVPSFRDMPLPAAVRNVSPPTSFQATPSASPVPPRNVSQRPPIAPVPSTSSIAGDVSSSQNLRKDEAAKPSVMSPDCHERGMRVLRGVPIFFSMFLCFFTNAHMRLFV